MARNNPSINLAPAATPMPRPDKMGVDGEVELMILEYLAHSGFDRAVNELKQQLRERRIGKQQAWRPAGRDIQSHLKERMLKALDRGDRGEVFKLWENFVPPLVRRSDREAQKLEFYLNVYFAIFPLHPSNSSPDPAGLAASMATFKAFLESEGSHLASTPEFLAYYALPYVPEISAHPSFSELFTQVTRAHFLGAHLAVLSCVA